MEIFGLPETLDLDGLQIIKIHREIEDHSKGQLTESTIEALTWPRMLLIPIMKRLIDINSIEGPTDY